MQTVQTSMPVPTGTGAVAVPKLGKTGTEASAKNSTRLITARLA